ncbi:MAG: 4Fe-4S binding protein [Deltaproteobacteria bacterium]|nr:4Fe-4S binding protein [Deltaproteobacteria bacterium]
MPAEVFFKLREQLDQYSLGYPATESGVEIKILEKLYTEEEAGMFLELSMYAEPAAVIAERCGRDPDAVATLLETMAEKGLVFRLRRGDAPKYGAVPFVAGVMEFQLGRLDRELVDLVEQYHHEGFNKAIAEGANFLRVIPINRSVDARRQVATYEDAREIVKNRDYVAIADCICRVMSGMRDEACDKPVHNCFLFGSHAEYYVERGIARQVTTEEAVKILDQAEEAGLVTQPTTTINPAGMCNCCGDCCGVLRSLNEMDKPAEMVLTNHFAEVDPDLCTACEICLDRCQMRAIAVNDDDVAEVIRDRCIGCGLCVTTCPEEAMRLVLKPEDQRFSVPKSVSETAVKMAEQRGRTLEPLYMTQKS